MTGAPPGDAGAGGSRWKALALMVGLVVLVDAVAIAIYFVAGIGRAGTGVQLLFSVVWTVVTLAVVVWGLRRVRPFRARVR
ncbi:MAG TPA: hypothetical protein VFW66_04260 [Gemmatimonadales bacterium]|nr:hypothetical protein [Gemmatimonadales bacterium]